MTVTDERVPAQWARGAVLLGAATARETQSANDAIPQVEAVTPDVAPIVTADVAADVAPVVTPDVADEASDVADSVTDEADDVAPDDVAPERNAEAPAGRRNAPRRRNAEVDIPGVDGVTPVVLRGRAARRVAREYVRASRHAGKGKGRETVAEGGASESRGKKFVNWLRHLPTALTAKAAVHVMWTMALVGSAVGQIVWWKSEFPLALAFAFAATFECAMIGASARARVLRLEGFSAVGLRIIGAAAALAAAGMNLIHLGDPKMSVTVLGETVTGSPGLGIAFCALTIAGYAFHEYEQATEVKRELRRQGKDKSLGSRWLRTRRAIRTKLHLIDEPSLTVDEAWAMAGKKRPRAGGVREGFTAGRTSRVRYGLGFAAGRAYGWMTAVVGRASVSVDEATGRTTVAAPARETAPKTGTAPAPAPRREVPAEDDAERTMPALRAVSETAEGERAPQGKGGRRGVKREALEWIKGELAAHRTPSKAEIMERFEIRAGSMRAYLSQWQASGDLPAVIVDRIKSAPAA